MFIFNFMAPLYKKNNLIHDWSFKLQNFNKCVPLCCIIYNIRAVMVLEGSSHWIPHSHMDALLIRCDQKNSECVVCDVGSKHIVGVTIVTHPTLQIVHCTTLIMLCPSSNQSAEDLMFTFWFDMFWDELVLIS